MSNTEAPNAGHGHVRPRPDGVKARCGGPAMCHVCQQERAALAQQPAASGEPVAKWDDPRVQAVYQMLCSEEVPPPAQHWEGWTARRIVDAITAQPAPARVPLTSGAIARCMLMVDDPLLWGRMGDQCGVALEQFARAIEAAHGIAAAPTAPPVNQSLTTAAAPTAQQEPTRAEGK